MAGEARQIVLGARGADRGRGVAEHDKIGLAVERQFEPPRRLGAVEHPGDSRQGRARRHHRRQIRPGLGA